VILPKYSMGIGDRFAQQGKAQLAAFVKAKQAGADVSPVWNKSNREHAIVGSEPASVRAEADAAAAALGWTGPYFVDADHIGLGTVDRFIESSDFFTIDVADFIGKGGDKYGLAIEQAGKVHRYIEQRKKGSKFIIEISMDETDEPQTSEELLAILRAVAREQIPIQTIAPKFSGRFNKGIDYVGDVAEFERQFNDHLAVIEQAVRQFGLPDNLKLSIHSGSDKFSIYPAIRRSLHRTGAGLHIKTAGTTWLEELIGLASAGGQALAIAREIYAQALDHFDELCGPYAAVIDIDRGNLPAASEVAGWDGERYARSLRHDPSSADYNPHLRQLLHIGYKIAARMGQRYLSALKANEAIVAENVTQNLFDRHLKPIFIDD
jgi:tagaturonate epimerase